MFARLFGRGKGDAPSGGSGPSGPGPRSDPHSALHKLDETIELTQKRVELLEKKQEQEQEKAKAYLAKGNKKAAMLCLQQKKMYEQEVERMQNVILNMMKQKQELEGMSHTQEVVSAQKLATDAQKRAVKSMKVEDVTKMQDEMEDIRADYEEVVQAIAGNAGLDVEDPDLQKELDELEGQVLEEKMLDTPAVPATQLPSAPRTVPQGRAPPAAQTDEEKELEELQREIGLAA